MSKEVKIKGFVCLECSIKPLTKFQKLICGFIKVRPVNLRKDVIIEFLTEDKYSLENCNKIKTAIGKFEKVDLPVKLDYKLRWEYEELHQGYVYYFKSIKPVVTIYKRVYFWDLQYVKKLK